MSKCQARRFSSSVECAKCGLGWDYNDPDPPECGVARRAREVTEWSEKKATLRQRWRDLRETLLRKNDMKFPLKLVSLSPNAWPEVGIRTGLYQLADGRVAFCQSQNPYPSAKQEGGPLAYPEPVSSRYYTVFGLEGRPDYLVLSQIALGVAYLWVADLEEFFRDGVLRWEVSLGKSLPNKPSRGRP